jgi:hypothetical protein
MLTVSPAIFAEAAQVRQIGWQDLIPETQAFDDPFEVLTEEQLSDLGFIFRVRLLLDMDKIDSSSPDVQDAKHIEQKLTEAGVDVDDLLAKLDEIRKLRKARAQAVVEELDGQRIRMPGYVLPLEFEGTHVIEFLLVPYVGACIHVPPPPPNQIIHVRVDKGIKNWGMFYPIWVTGELSVKGSTQSLFLVDGTTDINIGYSMNTSAKHVEPYQQ